MIVGVNATKDAIYVANTNGDPTSFVIESTRRITFSLSVPTELADLLDQMSVVLSTLSEEDTLAVLKCCSGMRGSSVQAIKAETVAEIAGIQKNTNVLEIPPQSLKRLLGCSAHQTWRSRSKELFNSAGQHLYWADGMDGAVAVAFAAAKRNT